MMSPDPPVRPPDARWGARGLAELLYRLRTEADTPFLQALSVGVGALLGCLPLYGLHLPLCLGLGRLLALNRVTMYLASNVNNPVVGPFLVYAEIQAGSLLRRGSFYPLSMAALRHVRLTACLGDLALGSLAVGLVLGSLAAGAVLVMLHENLRDQFRKRLVERAARPYLGCGYHHWEFARAKLRHDPVFLELVVGGWLPERGRLLDLGCGRGILLSLVDSYRSPESVDGCPVDWAAPPQQLELVGLEGRLRTAAVARRALAGRARVRWADLNRVELPRCAAAILVDVLHYLGREEQERLLARVRAALEPGGVLIVREADAAATTRFAVTAAAERVCAVLSGHSRQRFCYRSAAAWQAALEALDLAVRVEPGSRGTPFANALLIARASRGAARLTPPRGPATQAGEGGVGGEDAEPLGLDRVEELARGATVRPGERDVELTRSHSAPARGRADGGEPQGGAEAAADRLRQGRGQRRA
jgi:uncharacterized protein (DUF2062 family)